jgi:hypothetical protein
MKPINLPYDTNDIDIMLMEKDNMSTMRWKIS